MMNNELEVRPLKIEDGPSFDKAIKAFAEADSTFPFAFHYDSKIDFKDYVKVVNSWPEGECLPDDFVPNTYLVGVVAGEIIGRISIRHELNEYLLKYGGHIGYGIVPSWRNKGYATRMLSRSLSVALKLGLQKILVTCNDGNLASRRVIEKNGGVLENILQTPEKEISKRRYWIDCRHRSKG